MKLNIISEPLSAVVIIPTTGNPLARYAIESVINQTYKKTKALVVVDGEKFAAKSNIMTMDYYSTEKVETVTLKTNVGSDGFYGHRIYAAFTHLVNEDYIFYLDEDNWFDPEHVESQIDNIEKNNYDWSYSLRKICDRSGKHIVNDDCESLGKWKTYHGVNHADTSSYCLKKKTAIPVSSAWHGGWGQDRVFLATLDKYFPNYGCTGKYSLNYRIDGNEGSVTEDFFINGNSEMEKQYPNGFPWRKN